MIDYSILALVNHFSKEFRLNILKHILHHRDALSKESRKMIDWIVKNTWINGFMKPDLAPVQKQALALERSFCRNDHKALIYLVSWLESNKDLYDSCRNFLNSKGTSLIVPQDLATTFHNAWTEEEISTLADEFSSLNAQHVKDEVRLMLCCVAGRTVSDKKDRPKEEEILPNNQNAAGSTDDQLIVNAENVGSILASTLAIAAQSDLESKVWMQIKIFFREISILEEDIRNRHSLEKRFKEALQKLIDQCKSELDYFNFSVDTSIKYEGKDIAKAIDAANNLFGFLQDYKSRKRLPEPKNIAEVKSRRNAEEELEAKISDSWNILIKDKKAPTDLLKEQTDKFLIAPSPQETVETTKEQHSTDTLNEEPRSSFLVADKKQTAEIQLKEETSEPPAEEISVSTLEMSRALGKQETSEPLSEISTIEEVEEQTTEERTLLPSRSAVQEKQGLERLPQIPESKNHSSQEIILKERLRLVWRLISDKRAGLAYHLSNELEKQYGRLEDRYADLCLTPSIIKCLALSPLLTSSASDISQNLNAGLEEAQALASMLEKESSDPRLLVLLSISLRPSLLTSTSQAISLLDTLDFDAFGSLKALRKSILDFRYLGLELTPPLLKGVHQQKAWEESIASLRSDCTDWFDKAKLAQMIYAPTTSVWREWLHPSGELGKIFEVLLDQERGLSQAAAIRSEINKWKDSEFIERLIEKTDKQIRGRSADLRPIEARAVTGLKKHIMNAVNVLESWVKLVDQQPQISREYEYKQAAACRLDVLSAIPDALRQVNAYLAENKTNIERSASALACIYAIENLKALFDPNKDESRKESVFNTLNGELLRIPGFSPDDKGMEFKGGSDKLLEEIISVANDQAAPIWPEIFEKQCQVKNHYATRHILDILEEQKFSGIEELRKKYEDSVANCIADLKTLLTQVHAEVDQAVSYDLLPESDLADLKSRLELPDAIYNYGYQENRVQAVRTKLKEYWKDGIAEVRKRLETIDKDKPISQEEKERIEKALVKRDLNVANELIDMQERGQPVGYSERIEEQFAAFFPSFVDNMMTYLSTIKFPTVVKNIAEQKSCGPLEMTGIPEKHAKTAAAMLTAWMNIKERRSFGSNLKELFEKIGFYNVFVDGQLPDSSARKWSVNLRVDPVADNDICIIPQYGSLAQGNYRVLAIWDNAPEEEIINLAAQEAKHKPLLVLIFSRLSVKKRRDLAYLCRERRRTLLVIDEILIYFLCGQLGSRLPVLFKCSFPFTVADPYTTTAGLVPIEMFYGRHRERESVFSRMGTSLVYGGRQLGKTALLRDVERRYHKPSTGVIVKWIDLKTEGIGGYRSIDDIWAVISNSLGSDEIGRGTAATWETLQNNIIKWLKEKKDRRIILLLDEADNFLDHDSKQGYPNVGKLKGIMDKTDRAFKVVFAGLHNAQRTSRDVNTPIAHLGEPICIGPLLNNGEAREALSLILKPFSTLGFAFDPGDLPLRILSQTNYYPSLIQIYCKHLLDRLTNSRVTPVDTRVSPPHRITRESLEAAQNQELRERIKQRFSLTLDLDPRYKVIALCIAKHSAANRSDGAMVTGVDVHWVREETMGWWSVGFRDDSSIESFRTILDEMVGLGVLRRVGVRGEGGRYALRSPNLLNVLGTTKEIDDLLLDAIEKKPVPPYEASAFRRSLPNDVWHRSPLTAEQESVILAPKNGVTVIFGSEMSGISKVQEFVGLACRDQQVKYILFDNVNDKSRFSVEIEKAYDALDQNRAVVLVPQHCVWGESWIEQAYALFNRKRSKNKSLSVVLIGDPACCWRWTGLDAEARSRMLSFGLQILSLKTWKDSMLRSWLRDVQLPSAGDEAYEKIMSVLGAWHYLIQYLSDALDHDSDKWKRKIDDILTDMNANQKIWLERFGFSDVAEDNQKILKNMAEYQAAISVDDVSDLLSMREANIIVQRVMEWAELMWMVKMVDKDKYELDPIVAKLFDK